MLRKQKMSHRLGAGALTVSVVMGGVAWAASIGSAEPVSPPSVPEIAAKSSLVRQANQTPGVGLNLDASRARPVSLAKAPAGLATARFILVPSAKGPCLLRNDQVQGTGTDEASKALVALGSLSCGAGVAPTVAITPDGTIGAVSSTQDTVKVVLRDGTTAAAEVGADGVWFAPPGASKATVTEGGSATTVDLDL